MIADGRSGRDSRVSDVGAVQDGTLPDSTEVGLSGVDGDGVNAFETSSLADDRRYQAILGHESDLGVHLSVAPRRSCGLRPV